MRFYEPNSIAKTNYLRKEKYQIQCAYVIMHIKCYGIKLLPFKEEQKILRRYSDS